MINYTRVVPLYTPGYTVGNYNNIIGIAATVEWTPAHVNDAIVML